MKRIIALLVLPAALVTMGGCAGAKVTSNAKKLRKLERQTDGMEQKVGNMNKLLYDLETRVTGLEDSAAEIESLTVELKSARDELEKKLGR